MNKRNRVHQVGLAVAAVFAMGQAATPPGSVRHPSIPGGGPPTAESCGACHRCDAPTSEEPCLRPCLRPRPETMPQTTGSIHGPDLVILNELEDRYLPVPFDHKGHAAMAGMTRGCVVCHHYTPEGTAHPACKNCHEVNHDRGDIAKPGLRGAYHRQCINCHREWSHDTACEICHQPKAGTGQPHSNETIPRKDDIMGLMHPPIPEPEETVFHTKYESVPGTQVLFRHKEHIHRFGFSCAECHREDSCSRCHEEGNADTNLEKTLDEHHQPCAQCHEMTDPAKCAHCHRQADEPKPPMFDHATVGWPLAPYHDAFECRSCHKAVPFRRLSTECAECHSGWNSDNFDHAVTGQVLNETHLAADCEDCHVDRKFSSPPQCDNCHSEEDNIAFPAKRPGPFKPHDGKGPQ